MSILIVTHISNVFFNWVLIFGNLGLPAMGVVGAGICAARRQQIADRMFSVDRHQNVTQIIGGSMQADGQIAAELLAARACTATSSAGGGAVNIGFHPKDSGKAMPEAVVFNHLAEMYGLLRSLMLGSPADDTTKFSDNQATTRD